MATKLSVALVAAAVLSLASSQAWATEICGNGIDDDGNDVVDEGCAPSLVTGICESPLSCGDTGMVAWKTGALHYDLPPDIAPKVPYGPGIGFRRFFTSTSTPGTNPTSVNKKPLGDHWQHTYLTYLYRYLGSDSVYRVVLHATDGRDVLFKYASTASGWESYTPQAGYHVMSLKRNTAAPNQYQLQLLTGDTVVYNSSGQVTEIWDGLAPTPNKVLITWDSTTNGNVSTVTDANGKRRLLFSYANGLMTSVQFQTLALSAWGTRHTTTYDYSASVTRDATSGWFVPANATEWTNLLAGSGIGNPSSLWLMQELSGSLADAIGTATATMTGGTYQVTASGWSRKGVKLVDAGTGKGTIATPNASTTSLMFAQVFSINTNPASGYRGLNRLGTTAIESAELVNGAKVRGQSSTNTAASTSNYTGTVLVVTKLDHGHSELAVYTDAGDILKPTFVNQSADTSSYVIGDGASSSDATLLYSTLFTGSAAQLTDAQVATLIARMKKGPGLSSVTIGGQPAQKFTYDAGGLLAKVADAANNQIAAFSYSSTVAGQVDLISTTKGTVGLEYSSTRTGCTGQTALYFNRGNLTSCSIDSDCGSGFLCGGKTGTGPTGTCFLAGRCLTTSTLLGENIVTSVAPLGPGGGSCSGACTDVAQYVWTSAGSNLINPTGTQDPLGNYTSATYNANGLPTQIAYGDTDSDPTNGGYQRTVFMSYDATYPGRLSEVWRKSELATGSCTATVKTACASTGYAYNSTSHLIQTVTESGSTYDATASVVAVSSATNYTYDAKGRVSQIDGAVAGIKTVFTYFAVGDALSDGFLSDYKAYKTTTAYLQPTVLTYDFWGNPTAVTAPDGTVSCQTFDAARGYLTQRREAMASQTTCTTPNAADLTTSWVRDSALRIIQLTRPDGSCMFWEYDTLGRLIRTKRRDDCNAASSGDKEEYVYDTEGLLIEVDTYDATGTITRKQLQTYYASRKLASTVNPVDISKSTSLLYDASGMVNEIDGAGSLSKTTYAINADRRVTGESRYKDAVNYDTWTLLYDWLGNQAKVTDGDLKPTETTRDDLGRVVEVFSPDTSFPTVRVYDAASRMTSEIEAFGGGTAQQTHTFSYDYLSRLLDSDYQGSCTTSGKSHPELQRIYDAPPTCGIPSLACNRTAGHLAYETATLFCSKTYAASDGALDQTTYFSFDDAGRKIEEYITDDTGRVADHRYEWTKNGALSQFTTPSGAVMIWGYGSSGSNSDTDLVTGLFRTNTSTPVIDTVKWFPYGPLRQYHWQATSGGTGLLTYITRNLAYRITYVGNAELATLASALDAVAITEDAEGRVTARDYTPSDPTFAGLNDSYFLYDKQNRVTCETTTFQASCPTTGSSIKNNANNGYTAAGDSNGVLRPVPGSTGLNNKFNPTGYGTSHQVTTVRQDDGTPTLGDTIMAYDERGNRKYDDNQSTLSHDRRDYKYDGRRNIVNVRGEYKTGGVWHYYDVASAFDAHNRRVYKSFYDETTTTTATWFFYYDSRDRLTEIRYTPDASSPATYSDFQISWLDSTPSHFWQTDFPSATVSKRYVAFDESARPIKLWTWPSSGSTSVVWAINPSAWAQDVKLVGASVFQPLLLSDQYRDDETVAMQDDGATVHRTALAGSGGRAYDGFMGGYLQLERATGRAVPSGYIYASQNPVGNGDVRTGSVEAQGVMNTTRRLLADCMFCDRVGIGKELVENDVLPQDNSTRPFRTYLVPFFIRGLNCYRPATTLVDSSGGAATAGPVTIESYESSTHHMAAGNCSSYAFYTSLLVDCEQTMCGLSLHNVQCVIRGAGTNWAGAHILWDDIIKNEPQVHLGSDVIIYSEDTPCGTPPPGGGNNPPGGGEPPPA